MPKFSKDEIQKIVLSILLFAALIYCYFEFLLTPIDKTKERLQADIVQLKAKYVSDKKICNSLTDLKNKHKAAENTISVINNMIPDGGAPIAWFPPKVKSFFEKQGITEVEVKQTGTSKFTEEFMSSYIRITWSVDINKVDFLKLGIALAGFENQFPLVRISNIKVLAQETTPELQNVQLNCISVFKP